MCNLSLFLYIPHVLIASMTIIDFIIVLRDIAQRTEVTVLAETRTQYGVNRSNTTKAFSRASPNK
jgi:hypothetical protein